MNIIDCKIDCKILCVDEDADRLNIAGQDIWLPCRIDLRYVTRVKVTGTQDFDRCSVFFGDGDSWIINIPYLSFLTVWGCKPEISTTQKYLQH